MNVIIFTDRIDYWRFIMNCDYDIRITSNKEIWNKNEMIAMYKPKKQQ